MPSSTRTSAWSADPPENARASARQSSGASCAWAEIFVEGWAYLGGPNPASVVRPGNPARHIRPTRSLLHRHAILRTPPAKARKLKIIIEPPHGTGLSDLQRCHRAGTPRNMGASDFFPVESAPRPYRNSAAYLAAYAERARIRAASTGQSRAKKDKALRRVSAAWVVGS